LVFGSAAPFPHSLSDSEAAYSLGVLDEDSGRIDAARELYRQALRYRPEYTKAAQRLRSLESDQPRP
jgi:tetratricopeptide (TPR) repeat protein